MNPAGELGLAARQMVARGTQLAGLTVSSAWAVLGALSHSIRPDSRQRDRLIPRIRLVGRLDRPHGASKPTLTDIAERISGRRLARNFALR